MALHFTKEEFSSRKSKVVAELKKQNLDALLMFKQESMYWLTGYDTFGYVFFQSLILTSNGDIILLTRAPDLRQAQNTSIIKDIRIWIDNEKSKPSDELKKILSELNLEKSNLGVEYDSYGLTGKNAIDLNNSLKNFLTLHDKSQLVSKLRLVKSSEEIKYVKKASELAKLKTSFAYKSVVASDAFFPFADGLIAAANAGVTAVIQPGGSIRDKEVIAAADERNIAMIFTSVRHFRH